MVSEEKSYAILILVPLYVMCFSSFKMFSLSLILCSLNMICLGVSFLTCTCFVFSGLLGFVLWCLSLLLENSQPLLFHSLILFPFFHLLLSFLLHTCYTFCNFPTVLEYSIEFDHIFSLGHFSWHALFIYLSMAVLRLHCCMCFFLIVTSRELFFVAIRGLLIAVASLAAEHGP